MDKGFMWVEDYRPSCIEDIILPKHLKDGFKAIIESGQLQHMMLYGGAGTGKTTVAKVLPKEMDLDHKFINASKDRNIDTLNDVIERYASTKSTTSPFKVVILDEGDNLNPLSTQPAMKSFMEMFAENCRFIITCNNKEKIIKPIHSRCAMFNFDITNHLGEMCMAFLDRICDMLDTHKIEYEKKVIAKIILNQAPDWRSIINYIESLAKTGKIDGTALPNNSDENFNNLLKYMKTDDFKKVRQWVVDNMNMGASVIFRGVYDRVNVFNMDSRPELVIIINNYLEKATRVPDQEINIVACLTEIKMACKIE